jgi:hypothetical protein
VTDYLPETENCHETLRLIDVSTFRQGSHLELVMDDEKGEGVAYLVPDE